jgi:hypothetical protein
VEEGDAYVCAEDLVGSCGLSARMSFISNSSQDNTFHPFIRHAENGKWTDRDSGRFWIIPNITGAEKCDDNR